MPSLLSENLFDRRHIRLGKAFVLLSLNRHVAFSRRPCAFSKPMLLPLKSACFTCRKCLFCLAKVPILQSCLKDLTVCVTMLFLLVKYFEKK